MAGRSDHRLIDLVTGDLYYFPGQRDRSPLSFCHPSHWLYVYYRTCSCAILRSGQTNSHQIAFIIPSKGRPQECYNAITPNDMQNDVRCALMGVILFFGAWLVILSCKQFYGPCAKNECTDDRY